jgi:PAS domain S-box-containing protein
MERWVAATLRGISDGVIATDTEGRVTFMNAPAEAMTGWTQMEAVGKRLSSVFVVITQSGLKETGKLARRVLADGAATALGEGRFLRSRDNRLVPVDDSITLVRDDTGRLTGYVVIFRDHTAHHEAEKKQRRLEAKMQEAQRLESLGVLASGIAHDFNNLLLAVTCNASLGSTMAPEDSPIQGCLRDIEEAANRAALLCRQMLSYSDQNQAFSKILELSAFTRDTAQLLHVAIGKNAKLVFDLAEGLPPMRTDPSQLQQVIMNLVINGSEAFEGEPGVLTVRTGHFHATRAFLSGCRVGADLDEGDYLMLEVSDTGHGMTPEVLARIFDPFFTTKFTGRGLGLAAISGIIRNHGGALAVQSTPGAGTTFQILFPRIDSLPVSASPTAPDLSWHGSGRALLVDDELTTRLAGGAVLRHLGFEVETAEDGVQGVEKAIEADGDYRVVLLDLTMPKLDGQAAFRAIRKKMPEMPVLLMSGYSDEQATRLFELGEPVGFIQKPFSIGDLSVKLQPLLSS